MAEQDWNQVASLPVYVIETIPVRGEHRVNAKERERECIPTPAHLLIAPELGRGGMGRVHPALDRNLLRHVALKRLAGEYLDEEMYRDGFIAEAQITGQLEHPNIVPVHELSIADNGIPYFTMKLIHGMDFRKWLESPEHPIGGERRLEQGLDILVRVCDAIAYAHHRGVIHRDLKPDNIMVGDFGQVYVMDWGLARLLKTKPASGERAQMAATGPVGTVTYMPPEQALGIPEEMDERSDVFGLGAILYELVSGHTPYGTPTNTNEAFFLVLSGKVIALETAASGIHVPVRLNEIIMKALAPKREDRYQTVLELQHDLKEFLRGGMHLPSKTFPPGTLIIREGDMGDKAFMIVSGSCRAFRTKGGAQETLATMKVGDVFGEMALLLDDPRAASVEALETTTVLELDKRTIDAGFGDGGWTAALVRGMALRFRNLEQQVRDSGMRRGS
jgi:eukaryotic-like serine/threonine-protein kinase